MRIGAALCACMLAISCLTAAVRAGEYQDRYHSDLAAYPNIVRPHRVVRFSEFDYHSRYPLVGCYWQARPLRVWRGNWAWGRKITCY